MNKISKKIITTRIFGDSDKDLESLRETFIKKLYKCFKHNDTTIQTLKSSPLYLCLHVRDNLPFGIRTDVEGWALEKTLTQKQYALDREDMVVHCKQIIKSKIELLSKNSKKSFNNTLNFSLHYVYAKSINGIAQTFYNLLHTGKREIYIECNGDISIIHNIINIAEKVINKTDGDIKIKITYIIR